MRRDKFFTAKNSFTLVELLVVIGILAILTAAIVIVLNPAELLKQSRDSSRMTDLANISKGVQLLLSQNPSVSLGTASTVYVSLADSSSTCGSYGLPALPPGYSYACASSASSTLANGAGWLPVDFTASPVQNLSRLPLDPSNAPSSGLYYAYTPNPAKGTFELTAVLESAKYRLGGGSDRASTDGGDASYLYEKGLDESLSPLRDAGLVGYWPLDEGGGTAAADKSGNGNGGGLASGPVWKDTCKVGKCLYFSGSNDSIYVNDSATLNITGKGLTVSAWANMSSYMASSPTLLVKENNNPPWGGYMIRFSGKKPALGIWAGTDSYRAVVAPADLPEFQWALITGTYDGTSLALYVNGAKVSEVAYAGDIYTNPASLIIAQNAYVGGKVNGFIDDVRVYNRALSAAEVQALYNATK